MLSPVVVIKPFNHEPNGSFEVCEVCFWEDDSIQLVDLDYEGGADPMSLRQAQQNFIDFGACDREILSNVRKPLTEEKRDENCKLLDKKQKHNRQKK